MAKGRKTGGRSKGSGNKRALSLALALEKNSFDLVERWVFCLKESIEAAGELIEPDKRSHAYAQCAQQIRQAWQYKYPRKKEVEVSWTKDHLGTNDLSKVPDHVLEDVAMQYLLQKAQEADENGTMQ